MKTILEAAKRRGDVDVVDDQMGRPTWHRDLATALAQLAREDMTGVLHVAGGRGDRVAGRTWRGRHSERRA